MNSNPVAPAEPSKSINISNHYTWGLWQFVADPAAKTLDVTQLRSGDFHLNALTFLEPPPLVYLTLESLKFNGNIIEADIGLRHPFLGLTEFTGFDVCGIFITDGSVTGFADSDLRMAGDGDTRLTNADAYSRWWNPAEFPVNMGTMFSYKDGLLGTPDAVADYNCTLNGYKYFADALDADDPLDALPVDSRGMFSAGQKNIRHYTIDISGGLIFNYAIDACWVFPTGGSPWHAPDDFPPVANRREAWRVSVTEIENTLWNDGVNNGGGLKLRIDVYDWYEADSNSIRVESPGNFDMAESNTPLPAGVGCSAYEVEIVDATPDEDEIELLISVVSEQPDFEEFIPGVNTTAYFTYAADVSEEPYYACKNIPLRDGVEARDIAIDHTDGALLVLYSDGAVYKHEKKDGCYQDGADFTGVGTNDAELKYIDIAPNSYFAVAFTRFYGEIIPVWFYDADGQYVDGIDHHPDGPIDVLAMTAGSYENDFGSVLGVDSPAQIITDVPRYEDGTWVPAAAYHDYYITDGNTYGVDRVFYKYVMGVESDAGGNYLWFLEDPDYYASRWLLYNVGSKGYLEYDKAYFGTGSQTDADGGWNDAKDMTRDNQNRYFVLDELSTGEPRVKVWTVDGSVTTSIGGFGNSVTISGKPLRIEGSDFDGDIVVLHGESPPQMISLFTPAEMPGG